MKRFGLIISALALVLGLSQCKKPNVPVYNGNYGVITFNAVGGGSKGDFYQDGESLKLKWQSGDKLYVYASESSTGFDVETGTFLGTMDIVSGIGQEGARFRGNINTVGKKYLRFVHVGQDIDVDANGNASCCYASQNGLIEEGVNNIAKKVFAHVDLEVRKDGNYTGIMKTEYSVIEFDMKYFKGNPVKVTGYTKDQISLNTKGSIEMSKSEASEISLGTIVNDNYYMIVLPENAGEVYSFTDGTNTYNRELKNGIVGGIFYSNAGGPTHIIPEGALPGYFTVDKEGHQVHFAKGNLQYLGTGDDGTKTPTWRFADNQYDYMGMCPKSTGDPNAEKGNVDITGYTNYNTGSGSTDYTEDMKAARDLFGWGCTGYQDTRAHVNQLEYMPYSSRWQINGTWGKGYGPDYTPNVLNLSVESMSDWGCLTCLPGNAGADVWFTLSIEQWRWIVGPSNDPITSGANQNCRASSKIGSVNNARFICATVNGVYGLIIFPDTFEWPFETFPSNINSQVMNWSLNVYDLEKFTTLESRGVLFLPTSGTGNGATYANDQTGYYHSTTSAIGSAATMTHPLRFGKNNSTGVMQTEYKSYKDSKWAVRLATWAE